MQKSKHCIVFLEPGVQHLYREVSWFGASACKTERLSRTIDQLTATGTSCSLCPNWFKDMPATTILEDLASFKPFERSLKSSESSGPGREGRALRICAVNELHFSSQAIGMGLWGILRCRQFFRRPYYESVLHCPGPTTEFTDLRFRA